MNKIFALVFMMAAYGVQASDSFTRKTLVSDEIVRPYNFFIFCDGAANEKFREGIKYGILVQYDGGEIHLHQQEQHRSVRNAAVYLDSGDSFAVGEVIYTCTEKGE